MGANWARHLHADASRVCSHVTQVTTDFLNKLPARKERKSPKHRHPVVYTDMFGIMDLPGSSTPSASLAAGCTSGPYFMLVMLLFLESVYYHRPVSSFMQNNLISQASKGMYIHESLRARSFSSLFMSVKFLFSLSVSDILNIVVTDICIEVVCGN